ncbi:TlpA family protein disulfide reductase [Bacillus licheniformis]|uniref:TlpA family protein disulfide reductase n=1 Tax=Bacillus licheniformis TaxID=1402 RepID=UPI002E222A7E|nr:hypothetical protein [Bacillus licheniformis]
MSETILMISLSFLVITVAFLVLQLYRNILRTKKQQGLLKSDEGLPKGETYPITTLKTIVGQEVTISKKTRGVILIFTSYGCSGCKRVYPFLELLKKEYPKIQFELIMLANKKQAQETISLYNLEDWSVSIIDHEHLHTLGITGFPFSYLISNEGKVIEKGLINYKKDIDFLVSMLQVKKIS